MNINPFDLIKNAQKIQEQMSGIKDKLGVITATGSAGGGLVEIDINGVMEVLAVRIAQPAMDDVDMLQDLIVSAFSDGMAKIKTAVSSHVGAMGIPGVM
jgi:DNA-binding YbaB/EbfC family protein